MVRFTQHGQTEVGETDYMGRYRMPHSEDNSVPSGTKSSNSFCRKPSWANTRKTEHVALAQFVCACCVYKNYMSK